MGESLLPLCLCVSFLSVSLSVSLCVSVSISVIVSVSLLVLASLSSLSLSNVRILREDGYVYTPESGSAAPYFELSSFQNCEK